MKRICSFFELTVGRCVCCATPTKEKLFAEAKAFICSQCAKDIQPNPQYIEEEKYPFNRLMVYGIYENSLAHIIPQYKYNAKIYYAPLLADMMLFSFLQHSSREYDYCIPVPQHTTKACKRGFYHLGIIAKYCTKDMNIPVRYSLLQAKKVYTSQQQLGREERLSNVAEAFYAHPAVQGKKILLLDDVVTTGSTIITVSQKLIDAGAQKVDCLAVAINHRGII